jgi:hypothetical protein
MPHNDSSLCINPDNNISKRCYCMKCDPCDCTKCDPSWPALRMAKYTNYLLTAPDRNLSPAEVFLREAARMDNVEQK